MLKFVTKDHEVFLRYIPDFAGDEWVDRELETHAAITLSRVFHFEREDLVHESEDAGEETDGNLEFLGSEGERDFRFARRHERYFVIEGRILDIPNRLFIADNLRLERKLFVAERNISIFRHVAYLLPPEQDIVIGGERDDAVPLEVFLDLLKQFPGTTELNRYAASRISTVLGDHFDLMADARSQYETYMNKARSRLSSDLLKQPQLLALELDKYEYIHDTIAAWLASPSIRPERDWQKMILGFLLLIFPKYVAVLENVRIVDRYSAGAPRDRFIDLALVDASGNLDVIEVKKPFRDALIAKRAYRDNSIPARELAGSIMQAEKYLFHLSKWGIEGERKLTARYEAMLPPDLRIRVTNPKAMIIIGRDRRADGSPALDTSQMLDLEVIKRKYANMMDIMTYDDLLRRLKNIIASLRARTGAVNSMKGGPPRNYLGEF